MRFAIGGAGLFGLALLGASRLAAQPKKIEFMPVTRDVIEERLKAAPRKSAERPTVLRGFFEESGAGESTIVVGGHFDFISRGSGVVDDWSGASLLPSLYSALRSHPRRHRFVFVAFTAEESGLVGSSFYVKQLSAQEKSRTKAFINLECLGLSPTKIWVSHGDATLVSHMVATARALLTLPIG